MNTFVGIDFRQTELQDEVGKSNPFVGTDCLGTEAETAGMQRRAELRQQQLPNPASSRLRLSNIMTIADTKSFEPATKRAKQARYAYGFIYHRRRVIEPFALIYTPTMHVPVQLGADTKSFEPATKRAKQARYAYGFIHQQFIVDA